MIDSYMDSEGNAEKVMSLQVKKVWWDGEKLMAEPIDPAAIYKEPEQPEQQDSTCSNALRTQGKAYPRTCRKCGRGPCIADRLQPAQPQQSHYCMNCEELGKQVMALKVCLDVERGFKEQT